MDSAELMLRGRNPLVTLATLLIFSLLIFALSFLSEPMVSSMQIAGAYTASFAFIALCFKLVASATLDQYIPYYRSLFFASIFMIFAFLSQAISHGWDTLIGCGIFSLILMTPTGKWIYRTSFSWG